MLYDLVKTHTIEAKSSLNFGRSFFPDESSLLLFADGHAMVMVGNSESRSFLGSFILSESRIPRLIADRGPNESGKSKYNFIPGTRNCEMLLLVRSKEIYMDQ